MNIPWTQPRHSWVYGPCQNTRVSAHEKVPSSMNCKTPRQEPTRTRLSGGRRRAPAMEFHAAMETHAPRRHLTHAQLNERSWTRNSPFRVVPAKVKTLHRPRNECSRGECMRKSRKATAKSGGWLLRGETLGRKKKGTEQGLRGAGCSGSYLEVAMRLAPLHQALSRTRGLRILLHHCHAHDGKDIKAPTTKIPMPRPQPRSLRQTRGGGRGICIFFFFKHSQGDSQAAREAPAQWTEGSTGLPSALNASPVSKRCSVPQFPLL